MGELGAECMERDLQVLLPGGDKTLGFAMETGIHLSRQNECGGRARAMLISSCDGGPACLCTYSSSQHIQTQPSPSNLPSASEN
ncbi:unnamed protein product [Arctogadus glacialis]